MPWNWQYTHLMPTDTSPVSLPIVVSHHLVCVCSFQLGLWIYKSILISVVLILSSCVGMIAALYNRTVILMGILLSHRTPVNSLQLFHAFSIPWAISVPHPPSWSIVVSRYLNVDVVESSVLSSLIYTFSLIFFSLFGSAGSLFDWLSTQHLLSTLSSSSVPLPSSCWIRHKEPSRQQIVLSTAFLHQLPKN